MIEEIKKIHFYVLLFTTKSDKDLLYVFFKMPRSGKISITMDEVHSVKQRTNAAPKGLNISYVCRVTVRFYIIWFSVQKIVEKPLFRNIPENFMPI